MQTTEVKHVTSHALLAGHLDPAVTNTAEVIPENLLYLKVWEYMCRLYTGFTEFYIFVYHFCGWLWFLEEQNSIQNSPPGSSVFPWRGLAGSAAVKSKGRAAGTPQRVELF